MRIIEVLSVTYIILGKNYDFHAPTISIIKFKSELGNFNLKSQISV